LYIRYIREQMKAERFDTCVIYSDVAAETAVRAVRADKYLMFYHHGAMRRVYHDEIGYRKSEKIIAVSRNQEGKLRRFRPKYADKMTTIHNLTDVEGIRRKAEEPIPETFREDQFHIVTCGRVSREKGMDLAVEACAKLVETGWEDIHWWIVGGGPAEREVREQISRLGMESHVTMVGMKENPYPYIKRADLYVQPSRFEGYPMTILEALVLGQPVISTDNNGAREIIQHEITGLLCPIEADSLAEAVQSLLKNPELLKKVKRNLQFLNFEMNNQQNASMLEILF
ncbi:MAG: glycosyltransferase, partial [Faecousia sp.]